ncbi:MAG: peptidoglycan DD-metalloendopeptidase family protein [Acidobacteriota bacterium]
MQPTVPRRRTARRGLTVLAALFVMTLPLALAEAGVTPPGGNGVAKDIGFTITPPWQRGKSFRNGCGYGCYKHDNIGTQDYFAIDWMLPRHEPVHPIAPGRVILSADLAGGWEPYGNSVMIEHFNGYQSFYAHLETLDVAVGDEVDPDTKLGTAGMSGSGATGVHLHFVLYKGATVGYNGGAFGPSGGSAVVPEPWSGCTHSAGGDCVDLDYNEWFRRDDFAPDAIAHADGSLELLTCARGTRRLVHRRRDASGTWTPWVILGGTCAGSPTIARDGSGRVYAFVRGLDGTLYYKRRDTSGGGWSGWSWFADKMIGSAGVALDTAANRLRVFARLASDDALNVASQTSTGSFGGWSRLGGKVLGSPAAVTRSTDGRVDAYVAGTDYNLYRMPASGSGSYTPENWDPQGTSLEGAPALVKEGATEWAVRSTLDQLIQNGAYVTGSTTHPPAAARKPNGYLHLFVRDSTTSAADYLYEQSWGWGNDSFGGLVTSDLEAIRATGSRLIMFTWGTGGLYFREQSSLNGTTVWGPWTDLTVPN